jgi:hypothetical protein
LRAKVPASDRDDARFRGEPVEQPVVNVRRSSALV